MKRQKEQKPLTLRMNPETYYVWIGGSCDYGHEERCSGGTYIMQLNNETIETYTISDDHTTEFRMILSVMIHAMEVVPEASNIVFITNVAYILQNYDKQPSETSLNADLITRCISLKERHNSVSIKIIPFHKYPLLAETHEMAHQAMQNHRNTL